MNISYSVFYLVEEKDSILIISRERNKLILLTEVHTLINERYKKSIDTRCITDVIRTYFKAMSID